MNTERLEIEVLRPEHAELLFAYMQDERVRSFTLDRPPKSVQALRSQYQRLATGPPPERAEVWLNWVLFRHRTPVGWLQATVHPLDRRADVAWVVFPHAWRQGYATEGTRWMLDHLRDVYGVDRAVAEIDTRNAASIALVERLGFSLNETVPTDEGEDQVYVRSLLHTRTQS